MIVFKVTNVGDFLDKTRNDVLVFGFFKKSAYLAKVIFFILKNMQSMFVIYKSIPKWNFISYKQKLFNNAYQQVKNLWR